MPDISSICVTLAICAGPLALVCWIVYRVGRAAQANPRQYLAADDDEEFWEADSPEESPPDFY
jgi:hypothetical protein